MHKNLCAHDNGLMDIYRDKQGIFHEITAHFDENDERDMKTKSWFDKGLSKRKHFNPDCAHLDYDNKRDCHEESEFMCMCCGQPVCREHKEKSCPYGGMGYVELEEA